MEDSRNEMIFLSSKQANLLCQLEILEERLDIYEQLHQQRARYGESFLFRLGIKSEIVDETRVYLVFFFFMKIRKIEKG